MRVVNILYHGIFGNLNFFTYLCIAFSESVFFYLLNSIKRRLKCRANRANIQATVEKTM